MNKNNSAGRVQQNIALLQSLVLPAILALAAPCHSQEPAIAPPLDSTIGNTLSGVWGMQFIPSEDIVVTNLGWFDHAGDGFANGPHPVGIYRVDDQSLVVSAIINSDSALENGFRYESITPTILDFAQPYLIVGFDPAGSGDHLLRDLNFNNIMSHPDIVVEGSRDEINVGGLGFPSGPLDTTPNSWRMGANFKLLVSTQDIWVGNSPIDGRFYFNWGPNWQDLVAPGQFDSATFGNITQTAEWSNAGAYSGDSAILNLSINDSNLVFQTADTPARILSVADTISLSNSFLALGDDTASTSQQLDADTMEFFNSVLKIDGGSFVTVDTIKDIFPGGNICVLNGSQLSINNSEGLTTRMAYLIDNSSGLQISESVFFEEGGMPINVVNQSQLICDKWMTLGNSAQLNVFGDSYVDCDVLFIRRYSSVHVNDSLLSCNHISIGDPPNDDNNRLLHVESGGIVVTNTCWVATGENNISAQDRLLVSGVGAQFMADFLTVGLPGPGQVIIEGGGYVQVQFDAVIASGSMRIHSNAVLNGGSLIIEPMGVLWLEGGTLNVGYVSVESYQNIQPVGANPSLITGTVGFSQSYLASDVEPLIQINNVETSQVIVENSGTISGGGEINHETWNLETGFMEVLPLEGLDFSQPLHNLGLIIVAGGTLTVDEFTNLESVNLNGDVFASGGILNTGDGEMRFDGNSTVNIFGDVVNELSSQIVLDPSVVNLIGNLLHTGPFGWIYIGEGSELAIIGDWTGNGKFTGSGNVVFAGEASPGAPGQNADEVTFEGSVVLAPGSTAEIELGGTEFGQYDRLQIGGDLAIDGELSVELIDGFQLQQGMEFEIAEIVGQRFGQFSNYPHGTIVLSQSEINLYIDYTGGDGNDIVLTTIPPFVLGDVNLDGVVNLLDVQPFVGLLSSGIFQAEADINQDGAVNLLDVNPFVQILSGS